MRTPAALAVAALALLVAASPAAAATIKVVDAVNRENQKLKFRVELDGPADKPVSFSYTTVFGTAGRDDFKTVKGDLVIQPGVPGVSILVATRADDLIDPEETFLLKITDVEGADVIDADGTGTIQNVPRKGACVNRLTGTAAEDALSGTERGDLIKGLAANDILDGGRGDDCLEGQGGRDIINGGAGDDDLSGGGDADTIDGGQGADKINAGSGKNNTVNGGPGNDNIATQNGKKDTVDCGAGSKDRVRADAGDQLVNCERKLPRH